MRRGINEGNGIASLVRALAAAALPRARFLLVAVVLVLAASGEQAAVAVHNDAFAAAQAIAGPSGTVTHTNVGATEEPFEPDHSGNPGGSSIWYVWTAPSSGRFTFDTCGSDYDTLLAVYTGNTLAGLTPVASNDDSSFCAGFGRSRVAFEAQEGVAYRIAVDGYLGSEGTVVLHWSPVLPPPNDDFAAAQEISGPTGSVPGSNEAAGKEPGEPDHAGDPGGASVWYVWTAPTSGTDTFNACSADFFRLLAVYTGTEVSALTLVAGGDVNDSPCEVVFDAIAGQRYHIAVDGTNTGSGPGTGQFVLEWSTPPPNDDFADAEVITGQAGTLRDTIIGATTEPGEPEHGGQFTTASVWYRWTSPVSGDVRFDTCGSNFDTVLAVYTGTSVTDLIPVAANDQSLECGAQSVVTFTASAGAVYHIAVAEVVDSSGPAVAAFTDDTGDESVVELATFVAQVADPPGTIVLNWQTASQVAPTLTTQASPGVTVGAGVVSDTATLTAPPGSLPPTGTITFDLYGPDDATCTEAPVFTSTVAVNGSGDYTSAPFSPPAAGTYRWVASYSGDAVTAPISGACNDPNESVVVGQAAPSLETVASSPTATVGEPISATATLSGGFNPTGTITFSLYGPDDPTCSGVPVFVSTLDVSGNGTYSPSSPFAPSAPGTYQWVAGYSGDADNLPASDACGDPDGSVVVSQLPVTITTQASTNSLSVPPGTTVTDMATLTRPEAGPVPTGTVTYTLVGPGPDAACTGPVAGTSTVPAGSPSGSFSVTSPGVYNFVVTYSGDATYAPVTTPVGCGDPSERFTVARQPLALATQASTNSGSVAPGTVVTDLATLTPPPESPPPTGTVTYILVGPNPDPACTSPAVGSSTAPVGSPSGPFTVTAPGTYNFVATYSGDAFYAPITAPVGCGDPAERFTVSLPPTTTTTSTTTPTTTTTSTSTSTTTTSTSTSTTTTSTTTPTFPTLPPAITTSTSTTSTPPPATTSTTPTTVPPPTTSLAPIPTTTVPPTVTTSTPTTTTLPTTTTTSTLPPTGTTTTVAAPVAPIPATVPAVTSTAVPATVLATTTTTAFPTTTTAAAPTTTVTTAVPTTVPPPGGPSLAAVNPDGDRSGPPGVGLEVSGGGYLGCRYVYFFFDGVRIGTVKPDVNGFVDAGGLSVPGDADPGEHRVTSSCRASGDPVRASTTFVVTDADVHRTAFATSLPDPGQVSLELDRIMASIAVSGLVILLFAFPSKLFNAAVEENYDEIRGWFRRPARVVEAASTASRTASFLILNVLAAVALGFLNPDFGLDLNSAVLVVAFTASLIVMSAGWSLPAAVGIHRRTGEWGTLNFLPGTLAVSVVMVVICRRLQIQPGYFYGALAGLAFAAALNKRSQGRLVAANWTWALTLSLTSWLFRVPVSETAAQPDASVLWIGLEAFLVMTFLWGIETLAVAMLPLRFLDGPKVRAWSRVVWAGLLFAGVFATVHVLLTPTAGYVGQTETEVAVDVLVVFLIFCAVSVGTWAYFRYRPERWIPHVAR